MIGDNISINSVNLELSRERENQIKRHLLPVLRLLESPQDVQLDVVLRMVRRPVSGEAYCIMLRLKTPQGTRYAVAMSRYLERSVREARDELRKSMSRSYNPDIKTMNYLRAKAHERYFVELFV